MKKSLPQVLSDFAASFKKMTKAKKQVQKPSSDRVIRAGKPRVITDALVALTFLLISIQTFGVTYYSRTNNGNWTNPATWSTVTYGNATNTGTYPLAGDVVNIGDGYTIYINATVNCATLNIGQGVSGILEYRSTANYVVVVSGNITMNTGSIFRYNTAVDRTHNCLVAGDFTNYGVVDFFVSANRQVNLTFNGNMNSVVTGIGTWDLNQVSMSKTTSTANTLHVQTNNFEIGIRTLSLSYGTYIHDNTGTFAIGATGATYTIVPNVIIQIPRGTINFVGAGTTLILQGSLYISGGTANVGNALGTVGIAADQNGATVPYLEISSGTLNVTGGICYGGGSALEPFGFRMTGGTINLNSGTTGTSRSVFNVNDVAGSSFYMSAGTIVLQKPNASSSAVIDCSINGNFGTVTTTGGIIQFGNALTPTPRTFNFRPFPSVTYPHFRITGTAGAAISLRPSQNSTANFMLLSLYIDAGKTFDIRSIAGTAGDTKQMTLLSTCNGTDALYNMGTFTARQSTVTFNTTGAQAIGGTSTTSFYVLAINNASGITLNRPADVTSYLSMVNGKLYTTNTNILTCGSVAGASLGTTTSYVDGPMVHTIATNGNTSRTFPIGKTNAHRPVVIAIKHSNNTPVTYRAEVFNSPASALPYATPPAISNVSAVRYTRFIRQSVANFTNGSVQLYYGPDDVVLDFAALRIVEDNAVAQWIDRGGPGTANGTGSITSGTFTAFNSYFALANPPGGGNPLPVSLASFKLSASNNRVYIDWITSTEMNNDHFIVERAHDNVNFTAIATVNGAGNSTDLKSYSVVDTKPISGMSYYRLKQVDFDGTVKVYPSKSVHFAASGNFEVFPTISDGNNISLRYSNGDLRNFTVMVRDADGKSIPIRKTEVDGGIDISIEDAYRKNGSLYFITAMDGEEILRNKFIITKN